VSEEGVTVDSRVEAGAVSLWAAISNGDTTWLDLVKTRPEAVHTIRVTVGHVLEGVDAYDRRWRPHPKTP